MRVTRRFTTAGQDPFAAIEFKTIAIEITETDPARCLCLPEFEVPANWSYAAAEYLARRFVRRSGVPNATKAVAEDNVPVWLQKQAPGKHCSFGAEQSAKQIFHRLSGAWTYWGWQHDYFDTEEDARAFYDECTFMLAAQIAAPASTQWLNTGLHWAYGIDAPAQGHMYVDARSGKVHQSKSAYERPQHHHCYIQSVKDELASDGGIMDLVEREARIFKYGAGAGCNMSPIRGAAESLSGGTSATGLLGFLTIGEAAAKAVKPAGHAQDVDRLVLVNIDHPDIEAFIRWGVAADYEGSALLTGNRHMRYHVEAMLAAIGKNPTSEALKPEKNPLLFDAIAAARGGLVPEAMIQRVMDYARQGFLSITLPIENDKAQRSQAYTNLAVRLNEEFMQHLAEGTPWDLVGRVSRETLRHVSAPLLMDLLSQAAWATGGPSVQFDDSIQLWHGCKGAGDVQGSGPHGEFFFLNDSACDVATLNLYGFMQDGQFNLPGYEHAAQLMTLMLDISITMAQYPSREIACNTYRYRPIGLSLCNMAPVLMAMGYAYDGEEGRAMAAALAAILTGTGYSTSAQIARELGAFEGFSDNSQPMLRVIRNHQEAALGRSQYLGSLRIKPAVLDHAALPDTRFSECVKRLWDTAIAFGKEYGYSNAQISLIAATPNVIRLLDGAAPGIDPMRELVLFQEQASHCHRKQLHPACLLGLSALGYNSEKQNAILHYIVGHGSLRESPAINHDELREVGFGDDELKRVEETLEHAGHISAAFDPFTIGERFCREQLGLSDAHMFDASFNLLAHLGFPEDDIEAANHYACGTGSLAGAPYLAPEDQDVFALGRGGEVRSDYYLSPQAHISMMAAVQPFLSGGIAHQLTLPQNTTIDECRQLFILAYESGLKALGLNREIAASPMPNKAGDIANETEQRDQPQAQEAEARPRDVIQFAVQAQQPLSAIEKETAKATAISASHATARRSLPLRRNGYTQKAVIGGQTVYLRTGEYEDGSLGEIFIDLPKQSAAMRAMANQFAIAVSMGLQHGVPLDAFAHAFRRSQFEPSGLVAGSAAVDHATSYLDYVFRELSASYPADETMPVPSDEAEEIDEDLRSFYDEE